MRNKKFGLYSLLMLIALLLAACNLGGNQGGDNGDDNGGGGLQFDVRPAGPRPTQTPLPTDIPDIGLGEDGRETTSDEPIQINSSWAANITSGRAHNYTFDGEAGQTLEITVQQMDEQGNPAFDLYGPDERLILGDATNGPTYYDAFAQFELPEDGSYTVRVYGYDNRSTDYSIFIREIR